MKMLQDKSRAKVSPLRTLRKIGQVGSTAQLRNQKPNPWPEPSAPSPSSPSAGPSTPRSSSAGRATETPDDRSPPTSPRGSYAIYREAPQAIASPPADTSPRSRPAPPPPPPAPHQSPAGETRPRCSPPP